MVMPAKTDTIHLPISGRLREFLIELCRSAREKNIYFCFLRNYEKLPIHCGFDLDCLAKSEDIDVIISLFRLISHSFDLHCSVKCSTDSAKVAIFDLSISHIERRWLLFDIQTSIRFSSSLTYSHSNTATVFSCQNGLTLSRPDQEATFTLLFLNALKKSKIASSADRIVELLSKISKDATGRQPLNIPSAILLSEFQNLTPADIEAKYTKLLGIIKTPAKADTDRRTLKRKVSKFVFYNMPFVHIHHPSLFVIQGPDGVGKTTAINCLRSIFKGLPMAFTDFHHISEWKNKSEDQANTKKTNTTSKKSSIFRSSLKFLWKFVPSALKHFWGIAGSELSYVLNVNRVVGDGFFKGELMVADRYSSDRFLKMHLNPDKRPLQKALSFLAVLILRKPTLTITLSDKPDNILKRKRELTAMEIKIYLDKLAEISKRRKMNSLVMDIDGMTPQMLSARIAERILDVMDSCVFSSISAWEVKYNNQHCSNYRTERA